MYQQLELSPKHVSGIHTSVERLEPTHRIEKNKTDNEDKKPDMEVSKTTPLSHDTCLPDAKTTQVGMVESVSKKQPMKETSKIEAMKKHFSVDFTPKKPDMEGSKTTPLSHDTCLPDAKNSQVGMVESVTKVESKKQPMKETSKIEAMKKHFSVDYIPKKPDMEGSKATPLSHDTCLPDAKTTQVGMVESVTKVESKKQPMKKTSKIEAMKKHFSVDYTPKKPDMEGSKTAPVSHDTCLLDAKNSQVGMVESVTKIESKKQPMKKTSKIEAMKKHFSVDYTPKKPDMEGSKATPLSHDTCLPDAKTTQVGMVESVTKVESKKQPMKKTSKIEAMKKHFSVDYTPKKPDMEGSKTTPLSHDTHLLDAKTTQVGMIESVTKVESKKQPMKETSKIEAKKKHFSADFTPKKPVGITWSAEDTVKKPLLVSDDLKNLKTIFANRIKKKNPLLLEFEVTDDLELQASDEKLTVPTDQQDIFDQEGYIHVTPPSSQTPTSKGLKSPRSPLTKTPLHHEEPTYAQPIPLSPNHYDSLMYNTDDIELQANIVYGVSIGHKDDSTVIANNSNIRKKIEDSELEYDYVTLKD